MIRRYACCLAVLAVLVNRASAEPSPESARAYLASIRPSPELQAFLDRTVESLEATDPNLRRTDVHIALLDISPGDAPRLAHRRGREPIYPASVVKFVYLMAAYAWQEQGTRSIDPQMDALLTQMIRDSSNQATQEVFARLTGTVTGPKLPPAKYRDFRERRLAVERWVRTLGVSDLHCVNPTYDSDRFIFGRDKQFLSDRSLADALPQRAGEFPNRNAMTAVGTAELLALLATDRALSPESSATVRQRMRHDLARHPHLVHRLAGGAARLPDLEVYSKSGTWGPIYADAGIVHHASGRQLVLVVFTEGEPPYRGDFIADLTERVAQELLLQAPSPPGRGSG